MSWISGRWNNTHLITILQSSHYIPNNTKYNNNLCYIWLHKGNQLYIMNCMKAPWLIHYHMSWISGRWNNTHLITLPQLSHYIPNNTKNVLYLIFIEEANYISWTIESTIINTLFNHMSWISGRWNNTHLITLPQLSHYIPNNTKNVLYLIFIEEANYISWTIESTMINTLFNHMSWISGRWNNTHLITLPQSSHYIPNNTKNNNNLCYIWLHKGNQLYHEL